MDNIQKTNAPSELTSELKRLEKRVSEIKSKLSQNKTVTSQITTEELLHCVSNDIAFGIETIFIKKVFMLPTLYQIPEAPKWLVGAANYQGKSVPVIHMGARISNEPPQLSENNQLVLFESQERLVGLIIDRTEGICRVQCEWFPNLESELPIAQYVTAIGELDDGGLIYVLSNDKLVSGVNDLSLEN